MNSGQITSEILEEWFPEGLCSHEHIKRLCPNGWERSVFFKNLYPSIEIAYQRHVDNYEQGRGYIFKDKKGPLETFDEFKRDWEPREFRDPTQDLGELLGETLWDIISDNNKVLSPKNEILNLGSFRTIAADIASFYNQSCDENVGYTDFYMGSIWRWHMANELETLHQYIFQRMKKCGYEWLKFEENYDDIIHTEKEPNIIESYKIVFGKGPKLIGD